MKLKGKIGDIGFEYEISNKKQNKNAIKDLKAFAKSLEKEIRHDSTTIKRINRLKQNINDLKDENKVLERRLKLRNNICLIEAFEMVIGRKIREYKDWEMTTIMADKVKKGHINQFTSVLNERIDAIVDEKLKTKKLKLKK